jgi:hypothetical protein
MAENVGVEFTPVASRRGRRAARRATESSPQPGTSAQGARSGPLQGASTQSIVQGSGTSARQPIITINLMNASRIPVVHRTQPVMVQPTATGETAGVVEPPSRPATETEETINGSSPLLHIAGPSTRRQDYSGKNVLFIVAAACL